MAEKTRPNLNFTLLCDDVRQEMGGKISLMGIFDNLYAQNFPALHPRLVIINEWSEGAGEFGTTLRILAPDRKSILRENNARLKMADPAQKHRDVSVHMNIEFKEPGTYWIESYLDGMLVSTLPLNVVQIKAKSFS